MNPNTASPDYLGQDPYTKNRSSWTRTARKRVSKKSRMLMSAAPRPDITKEIGRAVPISPVIPMHDGKEMQFFSDGSLRHAGGIIRGKAAVKALKRSRHRSNK